MKNGVQTTIPQVIPNVKVEEARLIDQLISDQGYKNMIINQSIRAEQ